MEENINEEETKKDEEIVQETVETTTDKTKRNHLIKVVLAAMVAFIIAAVILMGVGMYFKTKMSIPYYYELEDGTKVNNSKKVYEIKDIDGLQIKITSLTEIDGYTTILGEAYNAGTEEKGGTEYTLLYRLYDAVGNEIGVIDYVGVPNVRPSEKVEVNAGIIGYYANVYDIKIELKQ